jgi:hypothetical protein
MSKSHLATGLATGVGILIAQVFATGGFKLSQLLPGAIGGVVAVLLLVLAGGVSSQMRRGRRLR